MSESAENLFHLSLFLAEGWCVQYLFRAFITPKWKHFPFSSYLISVIWVVSHVVCVIAVPDLDLSPFMKLLCYTALLFLFSLFWYRGSLLLKLFLVIQFIMIHELCAWAGNSLLWFHSVVVDLLADRVLRGKLALETFQAALPALSTGSILLSGVLREVLTIFFIRKIIKSCRHRQSFERDVIYYLLPAAAGLLTAAFIRTVIFTMEDGNIVTLYQTHPSIYLLIPLIALTLLSANVFSFETCQKMIEAEEARAGRLILENQIAGLKNSLAETERQHEKIRAVKHDMNNHMMVLRRLLGEDGNWSEEARQYFEGLSAAVDQLDSRVHTGNMVGDAVIGGKFQYAEKEIPGIRLDADDFLLPGDSLIKDYDIGIILNNGLDNAIEACLRLRQKALEAEAYITVRSFLRKNMLFIEIENSFDGSIEIDEETCCPRSTKGDHDTHGIGLKNIRSCAKKYDGDLDCIVRDKVFILSVMLKAGPCQ